MLNKELIKDLNKLKCHNRDCVSFRTCRGADRTFSPRSRDKLVLWADVDDLLCGRKIRVAPKGAEGLFFPIKKLYTQQKVVKK